MSFGFTRDTPLGTVANRFKIKEIFQHFEDREYPPCYHPYMVASINNCQILAENFMKIKEEFSIELPDDADPFGSPIAAEMEETARQASELLCEEVMLDLEVKFEVYLSVTLKFLS